MDLPKKMIQVLRRFEEILSERVWEWANVLLLGAILTPEERTVTAILRVMGQSQEQPCQNDHRVLNRAKWSSRALTRVVFSLLVRTFVPDDAPIVVGIDETVERRRGAKIAARGISRDPVRSRQAFCGQNMWLPLGLDDAPCADPLGEERLGVAVSERACSI